MQQAASDSDSFQTEARKINREGVWTKSGLTVLSGFKNMYHAEVLPVQDPEYPFRMWFFGWAAGDCNPGFNGCDAIFLARGKSLDQWEVYCGEDQWDERHESEKCVPVLVPEGTIYDAWHNGDPSIVFHEKRFYMAYSATGPNKDGIRFGLPNDEDGDLYCVMGAVSDDGIHWTRSARPLLIYTPEIGGKADANDAYIHGMYHRPSLLFEAGKWRLWFDYWTGNSVAMGYAEADEAQFMKGGFTVLRAGEHPLLPEWPNPAVIKAGGKYYSFSDPSGYGEGWAGRQLAEAESDDGITWRILGWIPPDPDAPACHVPSPMIHHDDEGTWLVVFYACQIGGVPYDYRYDRIRYMKRKLPE